MAINTEKLEKILHHYNVNLLTVTGRIASSATEGTSPGIVDTWGGGVDISNSIINETFKEDDTGGITTTTTLAFLYPNDKLGTSVREDIWEVPFSHDVIQLRRLTNRYGVYYRAYPYRHRTGATKTLVARADLTRMTMYYIEEAATQRFLTCPHCGGKHMTVNIHTQLYHCGLCRSWGDAYDLFLAFNPKATLEDFSQDLVNFPII